MTEIYKPGQKVADRKERFAALLAFIAKHGGWVVSIPGKIDVEMQCLPDSPLPGLLKAAGYRDITEIGETERIIPGQIVERFGRTAGGELVPLTAESTAKVAEVRHHAGICRVFRYSFTMP